MADSKYTPHVLIVDDDVPLTLAMRRSLHSAGIVTHTATSGKQAIEMLTQDAYEVLVVDINMPGMNGDELAEYVYHSLPEIACIAITGDAHLERIRKLCSLDNVIAVLQKPLDSFGLALMIQELCRAAPELRRNYAHWEKYLQRAGFVCIRAGGASEAAST